MYTDTVSKVWTCTDHHSMNARVDEDKHPNGRRHVTHASPHTHHGTGVVVCLERGAQLALGQDDEGVEDFIELAQVEDPSVEGEAFVPDATQVGAAWSFIYPECNIVGVRQPPSLILTIVDGIAKTGRTVKPGHTVHEAIGTLGAQRVHHAVAHHANHAQKGPCRVDGQENVVDDDKCVEKTSLAEGPGLFAVGDVVLVQELRRDGIHDGDGYGDLGVQSGPVKMVGDQDWGS